MRTDVIYEAHCKWHFTGFEISREVVSIGATRISKTDTIIYEEVINSYIT